MKTATRPRSLALRVLPALLASLAFTATANAQDAQPHGGSSPAPVYLSDLTQVYDGSPKSVTVETDPPNLSVEVTYDGSTIAPTDAGTYQVIATVTDPNYNGQAEAEFVILKAPQSIYFDPIPSHSYGDPPFQVNAYADSGLPITFTVESGPAEIDGDMVTITGTGPVTINAAQFGDNNYEAAESIQQTFDVDAAQTSTSIASSVNPSAYGQEVSFTATVASAQNRFPQSVRVQRSVASVPGPTGSVRFQIDGQDWGGPEPLDGNGNATISTNALSPGFHTITADYLGEENYQPSTGYLQDGQDVVASSNADLSDLTMSDAALMPDFTAENTSYTASVPNEVTTVIVTPTVAYTGYMRPDGRSHGAGPRVVTPGGATVTVNGMPVASGSASGPIGLNVGDNPIEVLVTAEDGFTQKSYTVNVTRAGEPEIAVEEPKGNDLISGMSTISFGTTVVGTTGQTKTFTIRNTGVAELNGLAVYAGDANSADFLIDTSAMSSALQPNESTTFTVTFAPGDLDVRTALLHIASNDTDENPFDIELEGTGSPLPTISIDNVVVSEDGGSAVFTVTQTAVSELETTFEYSTADGTATATDDYTAMNATQGMIPAGSTTTTISIPINDDDVHENTEAFTVTLSNAQNAAIDVATGTATIEDDDDAPTFTIDSVSQAEGNKGTTNFVFTVSKNGLSAVGSMVDFETVDGSATAKSGDYVATNGTLTFAPDETSQQIIVVVNGDRVAEEDEAFTVVLSNPITAKGERLPAIVSGGVGAIINDDHAPVAADVPASTDENKETTVTLSASDADGDALTFEIVDGPTHGTLGPVSALSCAGGDCTATVIYTPENNYGGSDSFIYKASDGANDSNTATVSVTVNPHVAPVVINANDSGDGSLRQALEDAADGDTITFDFGSATGPQTIGLTSELLIAKDVTIDGQNSDSVILSGGGVTRIFNISAENSVTISNLTLDDGQAATGGAILNAGTLALSNCTLSNNTATTQGGAVQNHGTLKLTNCTLAGNSAGNVGGAILNGPGSTLALGNVTLVHNSAGVSGGGIHSSGTATIANSIVALNSAPTGPNIFSSTGIVTSGGYNLSNDNAGGFFAAATDQVNTDPNLGPLKDNTGMTLTYAPLSNSPAIDRGKDTGADGNPTSRDQRNVARPQTYSLAITPPATSDRSDIGAVEATAGPLPQSAVSRKMHGTAGSFDINLPLAGPVGVECRSGGPTNDFQVVALFASPITIESAAITSGVGSVTSTSGNVTEIETNGTIQGSTSITINLTGVANAQRLNIGLFGVSDGGGKTDVGIQFGILLGDTTGEGSVNSSDVGEAKMRSGETATSSNFRADVNANGVVNASDVSAVKLKSGSSLPGN